MLKNGEKLGAFIVPTGIGATVGGYAGDASKWARKFSQKCKLIVNPNVVNAACFSGINENMLYVEGHTLNRFFKNEINLMPSNNNKIGIIFDKDIPNNVLNVHINTINAVKTVYDINIIGYEITDEPVGIEFYIENTGISTGNIKNLDTLKTAAQKLIKKGAQAIAIVCYFPEDDGSEDYQNGNGVDPVGGVEAIISHYISNELNVPSAHAPAFNDISICTEIVDAKCSAEYITPTFLPCILLGLNQAPEITQNGGINITQLDFLVMPYNSLGSVPVFECIKRNIPVYGIKENSTILDVTKEKLNLNINLTDSYEELLSKI